MRDILGDEHCISGVESVDSSMVYFRLLEDKIGHPKTAKHRSRYLTFTALISHLLSPEVSFNSR